MKRLWITLSLILVVICVVIVMNILPTVRQISMEGVKFQLGEENNQILKPVTINIDGRLSKKITGTMTFTGKIEVEGEVLPVPEEHRQLEIKFSKEGAGTIVYSYVDDGRPMLYSYGNIFVNSSFSQIAITVYDQNTINNGWTAENGVMIAAPAQNRSEAIEMSNNLMKKYLMEYELK